MVARFFQPIIGVVNPTYEIHPLVGIQHTIQNASQRTQLLSMYSVVLFHLLYSTFSSIRKRLLVGKNKI